MRFSLAMLLFLLPPLPATSETLNFAVYQLSGDARTLIAEGKLDYTLDDIDVTKWGSMHGRPTFKKSLKLKEGFRISTLVVQRDPDPDSACRSRTITIPTDSAGNGSNLKMVTSTRSCRGRGTCA